jgi:hypothetical protein
MKSITIHGIDDPLAELIKSKAQSERLSINKTIKKRLILLYPSTMCGLPLIHSKPAQPSSRMTAILKILQGFVGGIKFKLSP